MRTRSILAATFGAAALLAAVPVGAAIADPGPAKPSFTKPQPKPAGWTLCATRSGKVRLATKYKPCAKWETSIPVAPVQEKDDKPAPYYVREDGVTKFCAPVDKIRGVWVFECKTFGKPKPAPTATATAKPAS